MLFDCIFYLQSWFPSSSFNFLELADIEMNKNLKKVIPVIIIYYYYMSLLKIIVIIFIITIIIIIVIIITIKQVTLTY